MTAQLPPDTVESWCAALVATTELATKLDPPPAPENWSEAPAPLRLPRAGRPPELTVTARAPRAPGRNALADKTARARLIHTFLHHELQAAELFAWAILAFPETPRPFREGLLRLCCEELTHARLYATHLRDLGSSVGAFPVRDWFWERVSTCTDAVAFVALQGLGLEGANLDHSARFAARFRQAGDQKGARILERIERDEIEHVAFAVQWFAELGGAPLDYTRWCAALPAPLTPALLRGRPLNRTARRAAGLDEAFLARLEGEPAATEKAVR